MGVGLVLDLEAHRNKARCPNMYQGLTKIADIFIKILEEEWERSRGRKYITGQDLIDRWKFFTCILHWASFWDGSSRARLSQPYV